MSVLWGRVVLCALLASACVTAGDSFHAADDANATPELIFQCEASTGSLSYRIVPGANISPELFKELRANLPQHAMPEPNRKPDFRIVKRAGALGGVATGIFAIIITGAELSDPARYADKCVQTLGEELIKDWTLTVTQINELLEQLPTEPGYDRYCETRMSHRLTMERSDLVEYANLAAYNLSMPSNGTPHYPCGFDHAHFTADRRLLNNRCRVVRDVVPDAAMGCFMPTCRGVAPSTKASREWKMTVWGEPRDATFDDQPKHPFSVRGSLSLVGDFNGTSTLRSAEYFVAPAGAGRGAVAVNRRVMQQLRWDSKAAAAQAIANPAYACVTRNP